MMKVVNLKHHEYDVRIDRKTIFGNPYVIGLNGDRADVIRLYKIWFYEKIQRDPKFKEEVLKLQGKKLGCWCYPLACHGDIIIEYLKNNAREA